MSAQTADRIEAIASNENALAVALSAQRKAVELRLALHAARRRGGDFGLHNVAQACADLPAIEQALAAYCERLRHERGRLRKEG